MSSLYAILFGIGALIFIFAFWKFIHRKNYPAVTLCLPYVIFLIAGTLFHLKTFNMERHKEISIREMQHMKDININEFSAIVINSNITFGDGFQCAGGIISERKDNQAINEILRKSQIVRPESMALIWLLDSRASVASFFSKISDVQKRASGLGGSRKVKSME
jgi:hypothetical protein